MRDSDTLTSEDQVTLKDTNGPRMRLVQREHDVCLCEWVDSKGEKRIGYFLAETLRQWRPEDA